MYHLAAGLFFALILAGSLAAIGLTLREYWGEIVAALRGEMPRQRTARAWTRQVRVTVRSRPVQAMAMQSRRRAAV